MLRLTDALGIARVGHLVCPGAAPPADEPTAARPPYAVVHAAPMFVYKQWHGEGWRALAAGLRARGLAVVATGGPAAAERRYLDAVWDGAPDVERRDGTLSWPQLTALMRGARVFVGPDTSVTHLAAASGCPTVALFGPTDPRLWGPVPAAGLDPMWEAAGAASGAGPESIQRRHNVWLVQHSLPCQPCQAEGCERHVGSFAACLDALTPAHVLRAVDAALAQTYPTRER
jgi:heptosyltransferase-3